ncbi:MAG: non-canonical purine NTP diphosphatase [Dysgonamonadaceae bacterium]|jgi:XTP/dITP diphosphohydrolase|nr:non-canonical purine NTP diphosphatase [Dysgonamonadaceae bacterium]
MSTEKMVFATNNAHKLEEVREILGDSYPILSLQAINCYEDIPETAGSLEGNALQKACFVKQHYGFDCFADDTGLEVAALDNAPGVYSARYAGEAKEPAANRQKLLRELKGKTNRSARFRTVIALIRNGKEEFFEGVVNGEIIEEERGSAGFGYDSLFVPAGYTQTFAEMGAGVKNAISHRAEAVIRLKQFLDEKEQVRRFSGNFRDF